MRIQVVVLASLLTVGAAHAQSAPPATHASDSWSAPAPAATVSYRDATALPGAKPKSSPFKFKERGSHESMLPDNAALKHSGKAAVGTMGSMDANGRPAVSCPQTPMDPACH